VNTSQRADPLIGRLVDGRYRVRARIARGGMATVYVATDLRLERRVALKVMHGHLSDDSVFQSRFIQEARAAARLADPHVVNVFDQGQDDDMAYLVMEYLPGITLRELMREQKRLSIPQTITIMDAILSGLAAAHRASIVHRDVKPENVLLAEDGRIKIGDFGLARATTANTASGQMLLGTIAYLAPELVTRGSADARSDIYALGIMLYEMLTGEQPYKGEQPMQIAYQHATDSVPRPSAKNPGVPEQLDELVLWATERSPDARPLDADEMLQRLRAIEAELGIAPQVARTLAVGTAVVDDVLDSGELTRALPAAAMTGAVATSTPDADNATLLRRAERRRATKGGWLLALVLILAIAAGGIGWFFGTGPGSLVAVPAVAGLSFEDAQSALAEQGLVTERAEEYSLEITAGVVIRTEPDGGARVDKESSIRVVVSLGPAPHDLAPLGGMSLSDATAALQAAVVSVGDPEYLFTDEAPDTVVAASVTPRGTDAGVDCTGGCTVHEGDSAALTVSKGPLPDVAGMSVTEATAVLTDAGVEVTSVEEFSDSVDKGDVIGIAERDGGGNWRPGDTVTLRVSKGPQLFDVPNVVGKTRDQAKQALEGAGFEVSYNASWNLFPDAVTQVTSQNPAAQSQRPKGTTVTLSISGSF
jgi:serine/threonine-protein kinase